MKTYLVGGAVRDRLLGRPVQDRDWVVVGATPGEMLEKGFRQVGADFPVFLHPETREEYALARTERKQGHGYHGFTVHSAPDVSLEEDLRRRDLTINAMAQAPDGTLVDPFGGQRDLREKWLRHVSPAFAEDPLRILRVARFAARLAPQGFRVAAETRQLMRTMAGSGELAHLPAERIWQETRRALHEASPRTFFEVLRDCDTLAALFPELDRLFGVPQSPRHHPEGDVGEHTLQTLEQACRLSESTAVRYAALVHDLGKGLTPEAEWPKHIAHEKRGLRPVRALGQRLKVPRECQDLALLATEHHLTVHRALELRPATLLKLLEAADSWRRPDRLEALLQVCEADARGRGPLADQPYPQADRVRQAREAAASVDPQALMAQGYEGRALGEAIRRARLAQLAGVQRAQGASNDD